jgi:hypothetical protein
MIPIMKTHMRSVRRASLAGGLLLALIAALFAGCTSITSNTTQYPGALHPPPADPAKVEITRSEPKRPHDKLGEISVDVSTDPAPPIEKVEQKLRDEGAKLGADAVVIVYDRVQPIGAWVTGGYWNRSVDVEKGQRIVGVAIKYKN